EGNLEGEEEEHLRYKCEINTISKYYTETPEIGQKLLTWNQDFKVVSLSCSAPSPTTLLVTYWYWERLQINHFWDLQDKRQNVHSEKLLFEEEAIKSPLLISLKRVYNTNFDGRCITTSDAVGTVPMNWPAYSGL
ncbi:15177_t:CDS:2, partial [Rhizophagus irregularis]